MDNSQVFNSLELCLVQILNLSYTYLWNIVVVLYVVFLIIYLGLILSVLTHLCFAYHIDMAVCYIGVSEGVEG